MFRLLVSVIRRLRGRRYLGPPDPGDPVSSNEADEIAAQADSEPEYKAVRSFADLPDPTPITRQSADIIDLAAFRRNGEIHHLDRVGTDLLGDALALRRHRAILDFSLRTGQPCTVDQMPNGYWIAETAGEFEIARTPEEAMATLERRLNNPYRHGA